MVGSFECSICARAHSVHPMTNGAMTAPKIQASRHRRFHTSHAGTATISGIAAVRDKYEHPAATPATTIHATARCELPALRAARNVAIRKTVKNISENMEQPNKMKYGLIARSPVKSQLRPSPCPSD